LLSRLGSRALGHHERIDPHQLVPLALVAVGLVISWFLPTMYVWGSRNVQILVPSAAAHPYAANLMKMPPDLMTIADRLLEDPELGAVRILAPERAVNYLTPYNRTFRFVQTRLLYTLYMTDQAGKRSEGEKRFLLTLLLSGDLPQDVGEQPKTYENPFYRVGKFPNPPRLLDEPVIRAWLDELSVKYAIVDSAAPEKATARLRQVGFEPSWTGQEFSLWQRPWKSRGSRPCAGT
jgi:hypothetical protein